MPHGARRAATFAILVTPWVAWAGLHACVVPRFPAWVASPDQMSGAEPVALSLMNWGIRLAPVALLGAYFAGPALAIAVASLAGCFRLARAEAASSTIGWAGGSAALYLAQAGLATTWFMHDWMRLFAAVFMLDWAGIIGSSISLGGAYTLQRLRHEQGASRVKPYWVFISGGALLYLSSYLTLAVPVVVWFRARRDPVSA